MSTALAIIWFVFFLTFLIFIHELGHFATAKWRGIKVLEFGIGFPPRIWGKQRGETTYSINWVPLGGFCKMLGEDDPSEPRSLAAQKPSTRLLVLSAGSIMMFIVPLFIFALIYVIPHDVVVDYGPPFRISEVNEDSPAYQAGVQEGDELLGIDGKEMTSLSVLSNVTTEKAGSEVTLRILRDSQEIELRVLSRPATERPKDQGALGIVLDLSTATQITERESSSPLGAIVDGAQLYWDSIVEMKDGIIAMTRHEAPFEIGGVVAAGQITTEAAKRGIVHLFFWSGLLSFNLGIVNLLPLPALDGGRIVFVLIEMARRGKRVSPETEGKIHLVGFALLIAFIIFITFQDIDRIIQGESLLP